MIRAIIFLSFLFIQLHTVAQKQIKVQQDTVFLQNADATINGYNAAKKYYIITWDKAIPSSVKIIRTIDEKHAIIKLMDQKTFELLSHQIEITAATNNWKLSPRAKKEIENKKDKTQKFIVSGVDYGLLLAALKTKSDKLAILSENKPSHSVIIQTTTNNLKQYLLSLDEIIFIDLVTEAHNETSIIGYDRSFHGINAVDYLIPGANGKNIVAGVKEQKMDEHDLDLYKRVLPSPLAANTISNHATVIASIIGGAGNSFYDGRGIANGCLFFPSSFANLFADDDSILAANKVSVQNHSYGTVIQQFYGAEAVSYDALAWSIKNYVPVFSSGNQGSAFATDGKYANLTGFANITGNFKMAKNVITVGAVDNKGNVAAESSAGPLYDGRIAPQLIALGPNGTSDAAAVVSGTIAVMQQVYADSNNQAMPPASLTKAILYNTVTDIYTPGIDYKTGYGLLDSYAAVKAIQEKKYDSGIVADKQQWTKNISVPFNTAKLKITLAWTDTVATLNNNKALVNDLDLEVKEIGSGIVYKPWGLNASANADSLVTVPIRKRDSLNTAEQVSIQLPAAGIYQVKVIGTAISSASIPFNIAYKTDTLNIFQFTSPLHASDVNRTENPKLNIKWKTFVVDTNQTGNLSISYNNGISWELIKAAYKIYKDQFEWEIKDTNSIAQLKMETPFGNFISGPFLIGKVTRPVVDFFCTDSLRLSWNKHVYASAYQLYTLTDSPYLKKMLSVTDTFVVLNRSAYPNLVYAVEPVLTNGLPAARSIASDVSLQGVECFYKTLYYNLQDQNKLELVLELSTAAGIDSIFFEKVSVTGNLLEIYGSQKTISNNRLYQQGVDTLPVGTTYIRARIKLTSGAIVYTNIISVITSGNKYILFYPNPSQRNGQFSYSLQQGVSTGSKLQIFDISGRLLRNYNSMPDNIDVSGFSPGMYIYKLLSSENVVLETGKINIQ